MECEFAGNGCDVKVPRRDLASHMTENAQHHLMTATLLNLRLTRELHQKMEEKDQQIVELKQQLTEHETSTNYHIATQFDQQKEYFDTKLQHQTEAFDAKLQQQVMKLSTKIEANGSFLRYSISLHVGFTSHMFTLSEFKKCQAKGATGCWVSEPFYNHPGGYRFRLNIDTNGSNKGDGTHLSAYLYLVEGDYDDERQWPITVTVRLTMLDQPSYISRLLSKLNQQRDVTCPEIVVEYEKAGQQNECINEEYYPLNRLQSEVNSSFAFGPQYLCNDSIKFKLELKIKH